MAEAVGDMASEAMALPPEGDMSEINLPVGEGGGALSPLSGAYLLVVLSEPMSESHKKSMVQKLRQGKIILSYYKSLSTRFVCKVLSICAWSFGLTLIYSLD